MEKVKFFYCAALLPTAGPWVVALLTPLDPPMITITLVSLLSYNGFFTYPQNLIFCLLIVIYNFIISFYKTPKNFGMRG